MSPYMEADEPPASTPPPRSNRGQRIIRAIAVAFAVAVFLAGAIVLLGPAINRLDIRIQPDAVEVNASTEDGYPLVSHHITDAHIVADLYSRIESLTSTGGLHFTCLPAPPDPVRYLFHFTRWGVPVEDARLLGYGCYPRRWQVSRFTFSDLRVDLTGEQTKTILFEAQLPPLSSRP